MKNLIKRMPSLLNCILIALFASVVVTGYMTIDIMAKFTTYVEVEDAARTAGFEITLSEDLTNAEEIILDAYDAEKLIGEFKFSVSSRSEVAAKYALAVDFPSELPEYLTVMLNGKAGTMSKNSETNVVTYRFEDATWMFEPNSADVKLHTLTFTVAPGYHGTAAEDLSIEDLAVSVRAEQMD